MASTPDEILSIADSSSVKLVRFLYCDTSGIIRGKTTHVGRLKDRIAAGIGLVKGMMAMNLLDQLQTATGLGAVGEVRLVPDLSTFVVLPYSAASASFICNLLELNRTPWSLCPRTALIRQSDEAEAMDIRFEAAFEPEFTLGIADGGDFHPIDRSLCFATDGMNRASKFVNSFVEALERQGILVEQYYPELGHGQHEVSIRHAPALAAADRQIWYRETLRGVALEHGLEASLAPKPFSDQPGNGCHLHISAWDKDSGKNLFWSPEGLTAFGLNFVAGILEHLPAIVALTCASVNSYRRLKPRCWSSAYVCWGYENREAAVRVPSVYWGQETATTNLEIKSVDSSCNPYLALAVVIAAGLDGVKRKLSAPEPFDADPGVLSPAELEQRLVKRLPTSLKEALVALEKDATIVETLGAELARTYLTVKYSECGAFASEDEQFELVNHRTKF